MNPEDVSAELDGGHLKAGTKSHSSLYLPLHRAEDLSRWDMPVSICWLNVQMNYAHRYQEVWLALAFHL